MKEEEKSIFPQKCQKIRGETTDCMMNSEGLKQGLKAFLTELATCSKTGLPENMIDIIFLEVLLKNNVTYLIGEQFEYMYRLFFFLLLNVKMLIFFLRIVEH